MEQTFWKTGSVVKLKEVWVDEQQEFTHGIIAQVYAHDHQGNVSNVSLFLYNPEDRAIYVEDGLNGIPTYVDYGLDELIPIKDSSITGYEVIKV
jgi:hypothetical protein